MAKKEPEINTRGTIGDYIESCVAYVRFCETNKGARMFKIPCGDYAFALRIVELEDKLKGFKKK